MCELEIEKMYKCEEVRLWNYKHDKLWKWEIQKKI